MGDVRATPTTASRTALYLAVQNHDYEMCKLLLKNNANVNAQGDDGESALMIATIFGAPQLVRLLLKYNANPNIVDAWRGGNTPLHYAAEMGDLETVKILIENGANIWVKTGYVANGSQTLTPLAHLLGLSGMPRDAKPVLRDYWMQDKKYKTNKRGGYHYTPLHLAALAGHTNVVGYLMEQPNINKDIKDSCNQKASDLAKEQGHTEIAKMLKICGKRKRSNNKIEEGDGDQPSKKFKA